MDRGKHVTTIFTKLDENNVNNKMDTGQANGISDRRSSSVANAHGRIA